MIFNDSTLPVVTIELFVDVQAKTMHILDESSDVRSFINVFSESIQSRILNRLDLSDEPDCWLWLCYHLDGFLTTYEFGFRHIKHDAYPLHEPFVAEMERRLAAWTGGEIKLKRESIP